MFDAHCKIGGRVSGIIGVSKAERGSTLGDSGVRYYNSLTGRSFPGDDL